MQKIQRFDKSLLTFFLAHKELIFMNQPGFRFGIKTSVTGTCCAFKALIKGKDWVSVRKSLLPR